MLSTTHYQANYLNLASIRNILLGSLLGSNKQLRFGDAVFDFYQTTRQEKR